MGTTEAARSTTTALLGALLSIVPLRDSMNVHTFNVYCCMERTRSHIHTEGWTGELVAETALCIPSDIITRFYRFEQKDGENWRMINIQYAMIMQAGLIGRSFGGHDKGVSFA